MALATKRWVNGRLEDVAPGAAHLRRMQYGAGIDWSIFAFGYSISGAVVTVNAGKVRHGTRRPVEAYRRAITITADNTWIFVAYTYGYGNTASIISSTSEPVDTEDVHNHALYLVTLTDGVASIGAGNIKHVGDIWLPGAFA